VRSRREVTGSEEIKGNKEKQPEMIVDNEKNRSSIQ
jgi:hypothetical protein